MQDGSVAAPITSIGCASLVVDERGHSAQEIRLICKANSLEALGPEKKFFGVAVEAQWLLEVDITRIQACAAAQAVSMVLLCPRWIRFCRGLPPLP